MILYKNGVVLTSNGTEIKEAFSVNQGKFFKVGSNAQLEALSSSCEKTIDLNGACVVPGFHDCHMHFLNYAISKFRVNLKDTSSLEDMIEKSKQYIKERKIPDGEWIISRGWNENLWTGKKIPTRYDLDKISTIHPIFFTRVCGHIGVANSKTLELININSSTLSPEGGIIDKENGIPTGLLRENAVNLVLESLPPMSKEEIKDSIKFGFNDALKAGLTSINSEDLGQAGSLENLINAYRELDKEHSLPIRITLQLNLHNNSAVENARFLNLKTGLGSDFLKIGILKLYQDGSLGGRTAAMEKPYMDTDTTGVAIYSQRELNQLVLDGHNAGFQIGIHCIGDRAMEMVLNSYENLINIVGKTKDLRPMIIHCQFTNPALLKRFKKLKVTGNVQPSFLMTDWPVVDKAICKQASKTSYAWKDFLNNGIPLAFSSDAPIESFNPLQSIYAAVTRKDLCGNPKNGWHSEENLSVTEAIKAYTIGSAYACFQETIKGTIEEGKFADFVILSQNILEIEKEDIKDIKVLKTFVGGICAYSSSQEF